MAASDATTLALVERLEDERYAAMLGGDVLALHRLLHADLVYMHSSGVSDSKASYIEGVENGTWTYRRIESSERTIRVHGGLALVFSRLRIGLLVRGTPKELDNRALAVWVADEGAWRLIALQSGVVLPPAA